MAGNQLTRSPYVVDTAATIWDASLPTSTTGGKYIKLIQWVDNASDIANEDDIILTIDGQVITGKIALTADTVNNLVVWEMKFAPHVFIQKFVVSTIDKGELVIWEA
jgi:hypothetical protein